MVLIFFYSFIFFINTALGKQLIIHNTIDPWRRPNTTNYLNLILFGEQGDQQGGLRPRHQQHAGRARQPKG